MGNAAVYLNGEQDIPNNRLTAGQLSDLNQLFEAEAFVTDQGDATVNRARLQAAIDFVATVRGTVKVSCEDIEFDDTIVFHSPMRFAGMGKPQGKWWPERGTTFKYTGPSDRPAFLVRGTSDSAHQDGSVQYATDIELAYFNLRPSVAGNGQDGILLDGSQADNANNGRLTGIVLRDVNIRRFGRHGLHFRGQCSDVRAYNLGVRQCLGNQVHASSSVSEGGANISGQVTFFDPVIFSDLDPEDLASANWAVMWGYDGSEGSDDLGALSIFGGNIQGAQGLRAGIGCAVYGTHFEGAYTGPEGCAGIQLTGNGGIFLPMKIHGFSRAFMVGYDDDWTGTCTGWRAILPSLVANGTCVYVTSGNNRSGDIETGYQSSNDTLMDDNRQNGEVRWRHLVARVKGVTSNRPSGAALYTGYQYYDTDLDIPIWWNGSAWKTAAGGDPDA